ncbi:MAG: ATP-dependent RecD-like DNA helicase [Holosporales bacterium]|jgi:exodeoxyribonuclease V alpha subunit|nr:ATP-dependent RecD-like DNA helicase [Holosporales bacterium]
MSSSPKKLVKIEGQLERIVYSGSNFVVAKVKIPTAKDLVTVVGEIPSAAVGSALRIEGEWVSHQKFGTQLKITTCTCSVPVSTDGIERYLRSGLVKGIGPSMAKRIVRQFGERTLEVIENSIEELFVIDGIGSHRIKMISTAWQEQKEIRNIILFLQSYNISSTYAARIYKQYGDNAIAVIKDNPYRLATDIVGIGFFTADNIAQRLGIDPQSSMRAEAGILFVLRELTHDGHVYCPKAELIQKAKAMLNIDDGMLAQAIQTLALTGQVVIELLENISCVFLCAYHNAETKVAAKLLLIKRFASRLKPIAANSAIDWVQQKISITLAERQREAVQAAVTEKLLVITGSPGTGKTTIIRAILEILSKVTPKIVLTAPTGRAAKRMTETTGRSAKTIHRLLEYVNGAFQRNENCPIDCDLMILDEASMVDIMLMHHLLKAVPEYATLILVGDINQLPSVGPGSVLKDIISSKCVKVVQLNEIFRQAQKSLIIVNSHKIINGIMPSLEFYDGADFCFVKEDDPEKLREKIILLVKERIPRKFGFNPVQDVQVLTPVHRSLLGTESLNEALQNALNPDGLELLRGNRRFRTGDKVMQIRNNYDKDVFNGDIGIIARIDLENQVMIVKMDERYVRYEGREMDELVLSYAISIHKSQGSEYPVVVMPVVMMHFVMLQRNLIYTGVTRGKKLVVITGSPRALQTAIDNNKTMARHTWLWRRLQGGNCNVAIDSSQGLDF